MQRIEPKLHQAHVMPARVGKCFGAVRCLQKGWRWGVSVEVEQRGFVRPRQPHFGEQAMRHNEWLCATQLRIADCYRINNPT
jgi:hypothetical protein